MHSKTVNDFECSSWFDFGRQNTQACSDDSSTLTQFVSTKMLVRQEEQEFLSLRTLQI